MTRKQHKNEGAGEGCLVIGGSAGSFEIIYDLMGQLPEDYSLPIIVVLHRGKDFKSNLKELFQTKTKLKIKEADQHDKLEAGTVFLAPVNYHLLVEPNQTLSLDASEPVWYCRPAIDVTLYSAADVYKEKLVVAILSGGNNDGAMGAAIAEKKGARIIIQDPADASARIMPESAVKETLYGEQLSRNELIKTLLALAPEN